MAGEVIVDALPYIDTGYDETGVRESALALVEEECRRFRPTKNYLDHLPTLNNTFETKLMANEFERIQNRQPMETLSMKRYELPFPAAGKLSELSAWQESVENSMAQLEHQWVRAMNLELMLEYGIETWKAYLDVFVAMQAKAQNKLQQLKKDIQDINWQRKQAQTEAGEKLKALEANWVLLVSKNYEIEQECAKLEKKVTIARQKLQHLTERQIQIEEVIQKNKMAEAKAREEDAAIEDKADGCDDDEEEKKDNNKDDED